MASIGLLVSVRENGGEPVCKKLYMRNNCMVLASGSGYPSIIVPEDVELEIWGVVRSSITQHL